MKNQHKKIDAFFDAYARRFQNVLDGDKVDLDATINAFAQCFIEASPLGVICGQNDDEFKKSLQNGYDFYKNIGTQTMKIIDKEITLLDDFHALVKVHWLATYIKKNQASLPIDFNVFYLIQYLHGEPKIFAYITGDEQQVLKDNGLIPA